MAPQIKLSDIVDLRNNVLSLSDLHNVTSLPQHQISPQVKVLNYIASGSHGTSVFKVQAENGNVYAAKIIPSPQDMLPREELIMQFSRFQSNHPGREYIIALYATANLVSSSSLSARILFYEYADTNLLTFGGNLLERRQDIPESLVLHFLRQMMLALDLLSGDLFQKLPKGQSEDLPLQRRPSTRVQQIASSVMGVLSRPTSKKSGSRPAQQAISQSSATIDTAPPTMAELVPIIIHADLKPDNIFIKWRDDDPKHLEWPDIKIADFGLAKTIDVNPIKNELNKAQVKTRSGLAPWAAPEWPQHSARSDLWSAVHMLYEIMQRGLPARAFKEFAHLNAVPKDEYDPLYQVEDWELHDHKVPILVRPLKLHYSQDLDELIRRALIVSVEQRPTAQQLLKRLADLDIDERVKLGFRRLPDWVWEAPKDA